MSDRGDVHSLSRYLLGKMLDHSDWQKDDPLPDLITPSDVDFVLDNNGSILFCELSSSAVEWRQVDRGQRWLYQSFLLDSLWHPKCSILCKHGVKPEDKRLIRTRIDVTSFQVMVFDYGDFRVSRVVDGNLNWQKFVKSWFQNPDGLRGNVIERSTVIAREC
jgi:hypothetical protein